MKNLLQSSILVAKRGVLTLPASVPPELTWYIVDEDGEKEEITDFNYIDFGQFHSTRNNIESEIKVIEIENAEESAEVRNPICYIMGEDSEVVTERNREWVFMRNKRNSRLIETPDNFEPLSDSPSNGYKSLASNIPGGTNIRVETKIQIPRDTGAGEYYWDYAIEYQYSV